MSSREVGWWDKGRGEQELVYKNEQKRKRKCLTSTVKEMEKKTLIQLAIHS